MKPSQHAFQWGALCGVALLHGAALLVLSHVPSSNPVQPPATTPPLALVTLPTLAAAQPAAKVEKPVQPQPKKPHTPPPSPLKAQAKSARAPEAVHAATPRKKAATESSEHAAPHAARETETPKREIAETPPTQVGGYAHTPRPAYPALSIEMGEEGSVGLRAEIDTEGHPSRVSIAKSSGFPRLDRAALAAVNGWRFNPARRNNEAIPFTYTFSVTFNLRKAQ